VTREEPVAAYIILELVNVPEESLHLAAALGVGVVAVEVGQPGGLAEMAEQHRDAVQWIKRRAP